MKTLDSEIIWPSFLQVYFLVMAEKEQNQEIVLQVKEGRMILNNYAFLLFLLFKEQNTVFLFAVPQ